MNMYGSFDHRFYDQLSRLIEADYNNGTNIYNYGYDVAGNLVDYDGVTRTYDAANQMTNDGTNTLTYDNNGNLRTVGSDTYTGDRANRLLGVGNHSHVYDGLGNRIQQTVSSVVTDYLNDLQPGLTKLLKQDDGTNVEQFVHGVRSIHAVDDGTDWNFYAQDGLGSVRAVVDDAAMVQESMSFDPYGNPMNSYGAGFGFTGEQTDANGSVFLRARYYEPQLGVFSALDPFEGKTCTPMSLNGYSWVHDNPIMNTDPTGMTCEGLTGTAAYYYRRYMDCSTRITPEQGISADDICTSECLASSNYRKQYVMKDCKTECLESVACHRRRSLDESIMLYTFDSGWGWQHHAFIAHWNGDVGLTYSGGPGEVFFHVIATFRGMDNRYDIEDYQTGCGEPLVIKSREIGQPNEDQYGGDKGWLSKPESQRTGPYLLLGGQEAADAKSCLDREVANFQKFQDAGTANPFDDIDAIPYCANSTNSNSAIFTLMRRCGIPNTNISIGASIPGANVELDYN